MTRHSLRLSLSLSLSQKPRHHQQMHLYAFPLLVFHICREAKAVLRLLLSESPSRGGGGITFVEEPSLAWHLMEATSSSSFTWSKTRVLSTFCLGLAVFLVFFSWLASSKANTSALSATTTSASSLYSWFLPLLDHSTARSSLSPSESGFQEPKHLAGRSSSGSVDNNSSNLEKPTKDGNFTQSWENNATRSSVEGLPHHGRPRPSWKPPDVSRQGLRQTKRRNGSAEEMKGVSSAKCDLFDGRWVRWDGNGKPYYPAGSCPHIDVDFNCHQNGRPDDGFVTWKWQPYGCNLPSLNATDFLERLRGKRLIFVGDSLNRNMWESLVCILRHSITNKSHVYESSGRREFKTSGYYAFRFEDNNCSVDFVRSPFLVREAYQKNATGSEDEKLRLDQLDETTAAYSEADVIVFNTGHWWTHEKTSRGIYYYQEGDHVHPYLKAVEAFKKALTTWARWIDEHINPNRTQVVFRGYSLTHFRGGQWNSGGQCHKETEPIFKETYIAKYPSKMRVLEQVLHQMKTPVIYLNISRLTGYRKDAHPAIYRKEYKTVEEQLAAESSGQDCSHWCLPGVPDTWNELLYASLLMHGRGSWKKR